MARDFNFDSIFKALPESDRRGAEEMINFLLEGIHDGLWEVDMTTGHTELSPRGCEILGYTREEWAHEFPNWSSMVHPDDLAKTEKALNDYLSGRSPLFMVEQRLLMRTGEWKWIQTRGKATRYDDAGKVIQITGTHTDITDRKDFERKITFLNENLRLLVKAIQELTAARTMADIMETVRKHTRNLFKADGSTFILKEGDQCYYADEDAMAPLWKGQRFPLSVCIGGWSMIHKSSVAIPDVFSDPRVPVKYYRKTFVKSLAITPIRAKDPVGAIGVYWKDHHQPDDTDLQLLQTLTEAVARAIENVQLVTELDARVIQRTAQLESANRELEAFSYSVSHDLRAPLRHIDGFINVFLEEKTSALTEKELGYLKIVTNSVREMGQLIEALLSFSRAGRSELGKCRVDMTTIVNQALEPFYQMVSSGNIEIRCQPLPEVVCDPQLLRQVWVNLLSNAIKYTGKRSDPLIEIGSLHKDGETLFFVKDNGAGFNMKYAEKLFGVFQRLHKPREFEGIGIGLAIVKRIVSRHGGRCQAEGAVGRGATFSFTIPDESLPD